MAAHYSPEFQSHVEILLLLLEVLLLLLLLLNTSSHHNKVLCTYSALKIRVECNYKDETSQNIDSCSTVEDAYSKTVRWGEV